MVRTLTFIFIAWMCLVLGACSSVTTNHLLGEPIDDGQAEKLNGGWNGGDSLFYVHALGEGKVQVAVTKWDEDAKAFKVDQDAMFIRSVGDAMILHTVEEREQGGVQATRYALSRLVLTETGEIIVMFPDMKQFVAAVEGGALKGETSGGRDGGTVDGFMSSDATNVRLTGTKEEIDAYLTPERIAVLFTIEEGGVLRRVEGLDLD